MPFFSGGGGSNGSGSGSGGSLPALSGNGAPSNTIGADGQIYIDKQNLVLYGPKTGGSWGTGIPIGATDWASVANIPTEFPPSAHAHAISDVTNLQTEITTLTDAIAAKQDSGNYTTTGHAHIVADVTGLQSELDQKQTAGSYANSIHNHAITDVVGLEAELNAKATTAFVSAEISAIVGGAPAALNTLNELAVALDNSANFSTTVINSLANKSDLGHTHSISEITNLQTTLDGKQIAGNYASLIHFHVPTDITGLIDLLNAKSDTSHGHTISEITSLQSELNSKAAATHVHVIGDVTNLQSSLDGKSSTGHIHTIADVTNLQTTLDGLADASHAHIIADITGLQSQLDGKAAASHTHQKDAISDLATTDLDIGSNKILYSNVYTAIGDLPSASTYHGMFAHVHNEGAFYASHAGNWLELALTSQIPTVSSGSNITVTQTGTDYEISAPPTGISWESVPATETSTGSAGDLAHDANYVYVCITSDLWRRVPLETFSGNTGGGGGGSTTGIYITAQPVGGPAVQGAYTLSIQATVPAGSISYQWQKKTGTTWSNVVGQVYSTFSLANLTSADNNSRYRCYLSAGTYDDVISTEAVVTIPSSGVYGVTSTKPGILFDRSFSDTESTATFIATGKNWTYPGWTLIKEETQWEYDSLNQGDWTIVQTGKFSVPGRVHSVWKYALVGAPPNYSSQNTAAQFNSVVNSLNSISPLQWTTTVLEQSASQNSLTNQLDVDEWTDWQNPTSESGKWNRSARFRTRVIVQKFENGIETQATTDYSEWSDWCADPGGNTYSNQSTVFTTQPDSEAANNQNSHTQLGSDIDGTTSMTMGRSVALSANGINLFVGASGASSAKGKVEAYGWSGSEWVQRGSDILGETASDNSGWSLACDESGDTVAIGAPYNDGTAAQAGHVRVYDYSGNAWVQRGSDIDGEAATDYSGYSVGMSANSNRLVVGAHENDGTGTQAGHARVFEWDGSAWNQLGADIDGEAANDESGYSVSINSSGSRVAISAQKNAGTATGSGHVRVFDWNSSAWVQAGADIDGEAANDYFGSSVALNASGDRLVVGAILNDSAGNNAGHARVFDWSGSAWVQAGADIEGEAAGDYSGYSVAISASGNNIAVGAILNDATGTDAGHVRNFYWDGSAWSQIGNDIDGEAAGDYLGRSVAMSGDGMIIAAGGMLNDGGGISAGHVRVYRSTATLYPHETLQLTCEIAGTNKRYLWKSNNSYEKNDWFQYTWFSGSDQHNAADATLALTGNHLGLSDVGTKNIKCLGASDWNKASFSNEAEIIVPSTNDTSANPVIVQQMGISVKSDYQNFGGNFSNSSNYYIIPHIKLSCTVNNQQAILDLLNLSGYGMSEYYTYGQASATAVMWQGWVRVAYEYTNSYSSTSSDYISLTTQNSYIDSDGKWTPTSGYVQSGNIDNIRARFCLIDMHMRLNGTQAGQADVVRDDISTVWSDWHYYSLNTPS